MSLRVRKVVGRCFIGVILCADVFGAGAKPAVSSKKVDFNREVRAILSENCFACHGPDGNKRKAGLRLDLEESATGKLESGNRAVVPGNVSESRMIQLLLTEDEDDRMPPEKSGKKLSKEQVAVLKEWIAQGAEFKAHWAYVTPERPELPSVKAKKWPRNEIDHFVLARLEKEGLKPSPEADKNTLLRRVSLDLTGLPPTVEELDSFLADKSDSAYEKVVDRLLGSQAFGEKFAQQWLDLARFADSDGYHSDNPRSMWQYRDYVINAFNKNKRFDRFTIEQIAGDLLAEPTMETRIATAFNRNGMSSTEGGADPDEYMNKYVTDRVNTFGTVFLGSSTACTECHDHKYDPFTQKEYYQLYDFFNQIPEKGLDSDPAPPFIKVPTPEEEKTLAKLNAEVKELEKGQKELLEKPDDGLAKGQREWEEVLRARLAKWARFEKGELTVGGTNAVHEMTVETAEKEFSAVRLEAERLGGTNLVLTRIEAEAESLDAAKEPKGSEIEFGGWSANGPHGAGSTKELFEKSFIDETKIDLSDAKWKTVDWKNGASHALSGENQATYFYRKLTVKSARYVNLKFGSDGGVQLWLNGAKVEGGKVFRRVAAAPEELMVFLKAGENQLLIKAHHGSGVYGLFFDVGEPVTKYRVEFVKALADFNAKDFDVNGAIDDKAETGWAVDGEKRQAIFLTRRPIAFEAGARLKVKLKFESKEARDVDGRFRLAASSDAGLDEVANLSRSLQAGLFAGEDATEEQKKELDAHYRNNFYPELKELNGKLAKARDEANKFNAKIPTIRVMEDMKERRVTEVRVRGDYRAKGDKVTAGVPHVLPQLPAEEKTNRMTLAKWLVDPKHPLLGRVTVNRYWAIYFGNGLVKTGNEFGAQGELPSHPDLLDWLAREFVDGGWDVKAFQKKIVMSATYRQSSKVTTELVERDPQNRLFARGPRIRLSAEEIRDCALDYAGLLDRKRAVGGPSVKPYQPAGLWEEKMFGGNSYKESTGVDLYRRSLYTLWKRTVLNPTLMTFDAPDRAICTEQRSVTCTPLQAFVTLNEKGFVEAARVLAARILKEGGSDLNSRITYGYKVVLARTPSTKERKIIAGIHEEMFSTYQNDLKAAVELVSTGEAKKAEKVNELDLAAWTAVANVLLNLDETITKE